MAENGKNFTLFKRFKRPKTLQTPLPTFPISATTLIIFGFLFINLFYKKNFLSPEQHDERYKTPLPTFPISATTLIIFGFLFINLFYKKYFLSPEQHDERYKKLSPTINIIQLTYFS